MMIKAIFKSLTGEKNSIRAIWRLFCTAVGIISSIYAFAKLMKEVGITDKFVLWVTEYIWYAVCVSIIVAIFHQRERLTNIHKVTGSDLQISFRVRDIFSIKADSYVIPTNTFFRTTMEGEYISPKSVQGRFQLKYFKKNTEELDRAIKDSLMSQGLNGIDCKDQYGNVKRFPVGTVAKIDHKGKHFYFLAINDVNEYGKPVDQDSTNIDKALDGLIKGIKSFGHCDNLCTPLVGTGRAAIKGATIERVFQKTVDKFAKSEEKLAKKLIICINPVDYTEGRAVISRLEKYLSYRCEYVDN